MQSKPLKVAVVHEWLDTYAGSERVLEQILKVYPAADLFAVVDFLKDDERGFVLGKRATTTFIQRLPGARKHFRSYLPLMPLAVEQLDLSGYDLVVSSSHAVAKGVITGPDQLHVSYVHSPIRYAWDMQHQYLNESGLSKGFKGAIARLVLHYMRLWDLRTANGVDVFIANSAFIARRIRKVYRREAQVIFPPVDLDRFQLQERKEDFYLAASRMVPYKKMPLIAEAFAKMPGKRLVMIGDGSEIERVRAVAGPNVKVLGYQGTDVLADHMRRARAFVFAAEEDFGIMPVEVQACGTPVIAFGRGGATETVVTEGAQRTGLFFHEQTVPAIVDAVTRFESGPPCTAADCRANAERFSVASFQAGLQSAVAQGLAAATASPEHRAQPQARHQGQARLGGQQGPAVRQRAGGHQQQHHAEHGGGHHHHRIRPFLAEGDQALHAEQFGRGVERRAQAQQHDEADVGPERPAHVTGA